VSKKDKTLEEKIAEAEALCDRLGDDVDEAEEALSEARSRLEQAEEALKQLEHRADDDEVTARTGPIRPAGDRPIRKQCSATEIPDWVLDMACNSENVAVNFDGNRYIANGHVMLCVDSNAGLREIVGIKSDTFGTRLLSPAIRADVPVRDGSFRVPCRMLGNSIVDLRYSSLVEDLFPGVEWWIAGGAESPVHALVDGHLVAVVMPRKTWSKEAA
jgi:hypothetical protein